MVEKIRKSDEEWSAQLSDLAYRVTRQHKTERAFTHDDFPEGPATYHCVCCGQALFDSDAKFDSGTGWPSFFRPIDADAIEESEDRSWFMKRIEVHCSACDAHLGHVFPDGPPPTGLRYCINGVALEWRPKG
ncbi:peptide-methionine (R)-S-oxide reductase [Albidovulum inexpectatum]|uniref:peptide-methionine (R)-S-oxide reductase n=1 Tax=Albidovulum inexpectatum TaxID=196587 RepID=A0A2S5JF39_9RHOB|nr:peptide-methionine (R)-S-oxide reductase MsrB [Albidovulum inexpectatum]PPB80020.1 peptide-methionine (R)-S-oxide reductase [Albidovulum inexpectatum]